VAETAITAAPASARVPQYDAPPSATLRPPDSKSHNGTIARYNKDRNVEIAFCCPEFGDCGIYAAMLKLPSHELGNSQEMPKISTFQPDTRDGD
jgi:hypothetical protein